MKLEITTAVMAGTLALAAPLAHAGSGSAGAAEVFAPYSEDYTQGEPIPPDKLRSIGHSKALLAPRDMSPRSADAGRLAPRTRAEAPGSPVRAAQGVPLPKSGL